MPKSIWRRRIGCGLKNDLKNGLGVGISMAGLSDPHWRRHLVLHDGGRIVFRPMSPDDELLLRDLLAHVSAADLRLRFFDSIKEFSPQFITRLLTIDGVRSMAFVAIDEAGGEMLGVVRIYCDEVRETGEYAILLRSDLKGRGLGWDLMQLIIEYAKAKGLKRLCGQVLQENAAMLKMCRELGFEVRMNADDRGVCDVALALAGEAGPPPPAM
jgi:RimJ/RimL family protein N-acetyltransferase